jgi:hypothetical protein
MMRSDKLAKAPRSAIASVIGTRADAIFKKASLTTNSPMAATTAAMARALSRSENMGETNPVSPPNFGGI